jgi:hypothetical protein
MCRRRISCVSASPFSSSMSEMFQRWRQRSSCDDRSSANEPARPTATRAFDLGLADREVARRVDGDHLFDPQRLPLRDAHVQALRDASGDPIALACHLQGAARREDARARRLRHPHPRLVGGDGEVHRVVAVVAAAEHVQVLGGERPVALDVLVAHGAVELGPNLDLARPVERRQGPLDGRQVGLRHVHEPAAHERRLPALPVAEPERALEHAAPHVQPAAELAQLHAVGCEPVSIPHPEGQRQPVGPVHQVFVLDDAAGDLGLQPVVTARQVGARVVRIPRRELLEGAPRDDVAVAERAERLAERLLAGIPGGVDQLPRADLAVGAGGHRERPR